MNQTLLADRLKTARDLAGLSQKDAADFLALPRSAISNIETGVRSVSTSELTKFSELYSKPLDWLISASQDEEDVSVLLLRYAPELGTENNFRNEIKKCITLCETGVHLEERLGKEQREGPPSYSLPSPRSHGEAMLQGERMAEQERRRLGIPNSPIASMVDLIASQGIWTSRTELPDSLSGLFIKHRSFGLTIIANGNHPKPRIRFSYAHEYAHALADRQNAVAVTRVGNANEFIEKRANAFAAAFLMPAEGIHEALTSLGKGRTSREDLVVYDVARDEQAEGQVRPTTGSQTITFQDVSFLAHRFGVSYQAAVLRLKYLKILKQPEVENLLQHTEHSRQYMRILKLSDNEKVREKESWDCELKSQITQLAVEAYRREVISKDFFVEIMHNVNQSDEDSRTLLKLAEVSQSEAK